MLIVRETHFESVTRDSYQLLSVPKVVEVRGIQHADTYVYRSWKGKVHNVLLEKLISNQLQETVYLLFQIVSPCNVSDNWTTL